MTKFEYQTIVLPVEPAGILAALNAAGQNGWQLVAIDGNGIAYLSRPVGYMAETKEKK
jgi:hypothetical protein